MNPILKKLGFTNQNPVIILNAPEEYSEIMSEMQTQIYTSIKGKSKFIQVFAKEMSEANKTAKDVIEAFDNDGHLWLCYPKGTSKKYKSDINRTKSWEVFSPFGFEPVTQVAIDDDWTAMRFKPVDKI